MNFFRRALALLLSVLVLISCSPVANGCGPSSIEPVFVFKESPDPPFNEFAGGKIGIVKPQFGRKTLVIAFRYLNDRSFGSEEQKALVEALHGEPPEDDGIEAVKTWVSTRKSFLKEGEKLPEIYTERRYGGYDFFPNCTKNAFEVAAETLKDRVGSYGADDQGVRAWLATQDAVFQNCGGGENKLAELGAESPKWLRKDREYQIGAALLYSLNFDAARARFEKIARDNESPWQQTADYLVARTLVRQASFAKDETGKREFYEQAELHLQGLLGKGGKFANASLRLLGLVKYRLRPEERVRELAKVLETQSGNENLRQDLIDYVWLLDKFEAQVWQAEAKRKEAQKLAEQSENPDREAIRKQANDRYEAIQRGEFIDLTLDQKKPDGTPDYSKWLHLGFKYDASEDDILQAFELELGRKLTPEEIAQLRERHRLALEDRKWRLSPNQKWNRDGYEGYYHREGKLDPDLVPAFLRADELTDWIFTLESDDQSAYAHAFAKWRATDSSVWLVAALTKTKPNSRGFERLLRAAQMVDRDAPAFPSIAFHLVRLQVALGRKAEARKLLDDIISWQSGILPGSAQNQFLELRMELAVSLSEFLRFSQRRPVTFYEEGRFASLADLLGIEKSSWSDYYAENKEEYEEGVDERFRQLIPWNDRLIFDENTVEVFNWHFPLAALQEAAGDPALPDYLRGRMTLAVWTRAILLKNDAVAQQVAPDVVRLAPEMSSVFESYLHARTERERRVSALYILLKQPTLSPFVVGGLPVSETSEDLDYYFERSWWCPLSETEYNDQGKEVPKFVAKPGFLTAEQSTAAARERAALIAIGDGKRYLGKQVLEWARTSPTDERLPEALFIAAKANGQYKYGCSGWDYDRETIEELIKVLGENYPNSEWNLKLDPPRE
jgi:hypothetical protein